MKFKSTFLNHLIPFRNLLIIMIPVLFFSFNAAVAQCWQWASGLGGETRESPTSISADQFGHIAITGEFLGTAIFGPRTLTATSGRDVFTVLLDSSGVVLNAMGGVGDGPENIGSGVAFDDNGNFFVTGTFTGTILFGDVSLVSEGSSDVFIVKYDASGNLLWAKRGGGTSEIIVHDIAADNAGNCFIIGEFYNSANFGDKQTVSTSALDVFIAKYDADGQTVWASSCGSISSDIGSGIAVDNAGNVYIAGYFQSEFLFGNTAYNSSGNRDVFVAKMDQDATPIWATVGGGSNNDYFNKIAVDTGGNNVYVTGEFDSYTADIDGVNLINMNQSVPRRDIMLLNFDSQGSARWGMSTGSAEHDYSNDVTVDENGDAYITGIYQDAITFGNTTLTDDDLYVAKSDSTGIILWAKGTSYNSAIATGNSITTFDNRPVITGDFVSGSAIPMAVFDNDTVVSNGSNDLFLARIGPQCNQATGIGLWQETDAGFRVFPNPFSRVLNIDSYEEFGALNLILFNSQGQLVFNKQFNNVKTITIPAGHLPAGLYFLSLKFGGSVQTMKMIKMVK